MFLLVFCFFVHSNIPILYFRILVRCRHLQSSTLRCLSIFAARYPPYDWTCSSEHLEGEGICTLFLRRSINVTVCPTTFKTDVKQLEGRLKNADVCWFQKNQDPARSLAELRAKGRALLAATFPKAPVNSDSGLLSFLGPIQSESLWRHDSSHLVSCGSCAIHTHTPCSLCDWALLVLHVCILSEACLVILCLVFFYLLASLEYRELHTHTSMVLQNPDWFLDAFQHFCRSRH